MNIALMGYGKMGKTIEQVLQQNPTNPHTISHRINSQNSQDISVADLARADVVIEFSKPDTAVDNIIKAFEAQVPVICGTTAWLHQLNAVKAACAKQETAFFYASNFSIGVNIFFEVNKKLAQLTNGRSEYKLQIDEIHHLQKLDAPSGTSISLAKDIIAQHEAKEKWVNHKSDEVNILPIISHRLVDVAGTHIITCQSEIDTIVLKHTAHSREGFAKGAIMAAEWIQGKKGVFGMKDMLGL